MKSIPAGLLWTTPRAFHQLQSFVGQRAGGLGVMVKVSSGACAGRQPSVCGTTLTRRAAGARPARCQECGHAEKCLSIAAPVLIPIQVQADAGR
jgi:hypothetical protein